MGPKRTAVLLDRDGVVAVQVHHLHKKEQLRVIPGAAAAIRRLKDANFVVVIITNQAVVARGLSTEAEVDAIHDELRRILREEGTDVDAIYYCPHHEEATIPHYRRSCPDRKPGPGLCFRAAEEWNLDLSSSYFVGDRTVDIQCGRLAGCRTILVRTGYGGRDELYDAPPDEVCEDLWAAADLILSPANG
jgi:D-glycero-D-manno-heptose 1,7-bisphosphate phosphatase